MFNHKLLPSLLIGLSTVFISPRVIAQSTNVEFNGVVSPVTSFEFIDQPAATLNSSFGLNIFEAIDPTIVRINTTEPINAQVSAPVPIGLSDPNGTQYTGYLEYNGIEVEDETVLGINEVGNVDVGVRMKVVRPQAFTPGNYTYRVRLSVTSQ